MESLNSKVFGGTLSAFEWNQPMSEIQAIIESQGLVLTSSDVNQLGKAIADLVASGNVYVDSGGVNTVVLTPLGTNQPPTTYKDGMRIRFTANNSSTSSATISVSGLGVKNLFFNNAPLQYGALNAGVSATVEYSLTNDRFDLIFTKDVTDSLLPTKMSAYSMRAMEYADKLHTPAETPTPLDAFFKPDGFKMYIMAGGLQRIYQYTLSTAWDVSTATYDTLQYDPIAEGAAPDKIYIRSTGVKLYIMERNSLRVNQYTLSTPWDISTATYDAVFVDMSPQATTGYGAHFSPDGAYFYSIGGAQDSIDQYTVATPWDLSTASYSGNSIGLGSVTGYDITLRPDGKRAYVTDQVTNKIQEYQLLVAWDISTARFADISSNVIGQTGVCNAFTFKVDGSSAYTVGSAAGGQGSVYQHVTNFLYT